LEWFHNGAAATLVSDLWGVWQATQMRPPDQAFEVKSCAEPVIVPAEACEENSALAPIAIKKRQVCFEFIFHLSVG